MKGKKKELGKRGKMSVGEGSNQPGIQDTDRNGQDSYLFRNQIYQQKRTFGTGVLSPV